LGYADKKKDKHNQKFDRQLERYCQNRKNLVEKTKKKRRFACSKVKRKAFLVLDRKQKLAIISHCGKCNFGAKHKRKKGCWDFSSFYCPTILCQLFLKAFGDKEKKLGYFLLNKKKLFPLFLFFLEGNLSCFYFSFELAI